MADENPTAGPRVVPIDLPPVQADILRDELLGWLAGIEEDLATDQLADAGADAREADAFRRLLTAVDRCEIALPDEEAREAMSLLEAQLNVNPPACELIFPTPRGRMWRERNFYRDVWRPTQRASGLNIRPHECRHSCVTHLRASGVNDADLAQIAGHRVDTMLSLYVHPLGHSFRQIAESINAL